MNSPDLKPELKLVIAQCREAMGLNFVLLMQRYYHDYLSALETNDVKVAAENAMKLTEPLLKQQHYQLHRELCELLLRQLMPLGFTPEITDVMRQLALTLDILTDFKRADEIYNQAFALLDDYAQKTGDDCAYYRSMLWYNRAQHMRNGETQESLIEYTQKAIQYYEQLGDRHGLSLCLNRLATILPEQNVEEKIALLKRVIDIHKSVPEGSPAAIAMAEINIGFYEIRLGNTEFGVELMRQAAKVIEQHTNKRYAALAYLHFARGLANAMRLTEAKHMCNYAHEIFKMHDMKKHFADVEDVLKLIDEKSKSTI